MMLSRCDWACSFERVRTYLPTCTMASAAAPYGAPMLQPTRNSRRYFKRAIGAGWPAIRALTCCYGDCGSESSTRVHRDIFACMPARRLWLSYRRSGLGGKVCDTSCCCIAGDQPQLRGQVPQSTLSYPGLHGRTVRHRLAYICAHHSSVDKTLAHRQLQGHPADPAPPLDQSGPEQ